MSKPVIITCAVTGAGDTAGRSEHVPVTPEQIAASAIDAARAGAAIVHIHVRDPETTLGSRKVEYYAEVKKILDAADVSTVLNMTAGMGGDLVIDPADPLTIVPRDVVGIGSAFGQSQ